MFNHAAPRATTNWNNTSHSTNGYNELISAIDMQYNDLSTFEGSSRGSIILRDVTVNTSRSSEIFSSPPLSSASMISMDSRMTSTESSNRKSESYSPFSSQSFEQLLSAFSAISKHHLNSMIEALIDWRVHLDCTPTKMVKERIRDKLINVPKKTALTKQEILYSNFTERKELAADYILSLTVLLTLGSYRQPELSIKNCEQVEFLCMDRFKKAHVNITTGLESLQESKKKVLDLFAEIIGLMSVKWFQKISDNFLEQASARLEYKYEAASFIRSLKYLKIRLSKPAEVNESVDLMKKMTDFFGKAKKSEIKRAFAESLANMLSPLAEFEYKNGIDYRDWLAGLKNLLSIAKKMCRKASYLNTAFPFRAAVLCLNPKAVFIAPFKEFLTDIFRLCKDKGTKLMGLDCLLHTLGYYLKIANESDQSTVIEILSKTIALLLSGKKVPPSIPALDNIYDATVDVIVMVANNRMDYAMKNMVIKNLDLDSSSSCLPETVYLALRAFLAIAEVNDMKKISSILGTDEKTSEFPWVHKLLDRTQSRSSNETEADDLEKDFTQSVRMSSPFSSYRTLSASFASKASSFYGTNFLAKTDKLLDAVGLYQYQEEISSKLSAILKQCMQVYGNFLQSNHTKPLHENLSKDKYASLRVAVTAISCIPRILPSEFTKKELCDMLCRFVVHQYGDIRDVSWETMLQLLDYHTDLRPVLVHSFAEMIMAIDDFRSDLLKSVLKKFLFLLEKWISNLNNPETDTPSGMKLPTVFGKLKSEGLDQPISSYFDPSPIEAVGVVLLCNLNPYIRVSSLKIFTLVRTITLKILESEKKRYTDTSTVADLIEESGLRHIQNIWKGEETSPPESFEKFIADPNLSFSDFLTDMLRLIGKDLSIYCQPTSHIALNQITKRILRLNNLLDSVYTRMTVTSEIQRIVELWSHFVNLACSMARKNLFRQKEEDEPLTKATIIRTTPRISSAKDLYAMIYPHLKSNYEKQSTAAVNALGAVPDDLLEILLDSIKVLENEAYIMDKQKKNKKKKDSLRVQISRVYSRLSSNIKDTTLKENEFIKEKFLQFIEEQIQYSKQPGNMYNIDLQSLRHHLFIVIDNISRKLYYYAPKPGYRTFDKNLRKELMLFAIQWTGYGRSSIKREEEELASLSQTIEKLKDPEEKRNMGSIFKKKTTRMKYRSCGAVAGLLLGEFFESNMELLRQWSASTRMENKRNPKINDENAEDEDTADDDTSTVVIREGRSSLRSSLSILDSVLRTNNPPPTTTLPPENTEIESLGITILKWIDEILCSRSLVYRRIGIEAIENALLSNPNLLDICIDQCYNCSKRLSKGYFVAICNVFERCEMLCSIPVILTLIVFKSVSERLSNRNISYRLLNFVSQRFFAADSESGNYPYYISNGLEDQYFNNQVCLAAKLALDHPQYAYGVLEEVYSRLAFLLPTDQRALLKSLIEWIPFLNLDESQILNSFRGATTPDDSKYSKMTESRRILDILFDITKTYAQQFPEECKAMWVRLSGDSSNIRKVMIYLTERGTLFSIDATNCKILFAISQKITYFCACAGPQQVVDSLVIEYIEKSRDDIPLSKHYREISPNIESFAVLTQRQSSNRNAIPPLVRSDIVLILLSEVAYDHAYVFRQHLPLLLQYMFIRMDHKIKLVSYNSKLLLVHLIHSLVVKQLPHNGGTLEQNEHLLEAKNLIHFLLDCKTDEYLWTRDNITIDETNLNQIANNTTNIFFSNFEDEVEVFSPEKAVDDKPSINPVSDNVKQLTSLVERVVFILKNEHEIKSDWGYQSLVWATRSSSIHNVVRSYQIYRTLRPELRTNDFVNIIQDLKKYLEELHSGDSFDMRNLTVELAKVATQQSSVETTKIAIVVEIIETLRVIVKNMDRNRLVLFPQIFWLSTALLHSDVTHIYVYALRLFTEVLRRVDISNDAIRNVIIASRPDALSASSDIQDLILKGLLSPFSEPLTIELTSIFFKIDCDLMGDVGPYSRFIMKNMIGLLPRLCSHIDDMNRFKCWSIASAIVEVCENASLQRIAKVFSRYSKGYYTTSEKFLLDLRRPFCEAFFPKFEKEVFDFFIEMLQFGPKFYQKSILSILHSFLLHANVSKSNIGKKAGFIATIIEMLKGPLWYEATRVLDVTVKNSGEKTKETIQIMHYQKSVTDSLQHKTGVVKPGHVFGYQAGNGIKQCIDVIQSIYKYSVQSVHEEEINLLELVEAIHTTPEPSSPTTIKISYPEIPIPTGQDDHLDFDMSDDETITEDSMEASTEYDDQATDSDLLSTASKYKMTFDLETTSEEEEGKRLDELLLQTLQLVTADTKPPVSPYAVASIPYEKNPSSPQLKIGSARRRTTSISTGSGSLFRKFQ
ncbi:predicted protein [Naegleria gruberi]|uniref:Predicted protein n=1 Tax=Naegleria gruberi TaxID=5762 RepID=D2VA49_NAEGR|nr:uncharacterized protein NAEGRDRAFT_79176 [Naegleria gruberi]EFC46366.1 predicted protein [Naegleria gruberi]|eukprot:XP_002679110.1 predicted protein [Naegleria gruberi strain NEG-M]